MAGGRGASASGWAGRLHLLENPTHAIVDTTLSVKREGLLGGIAKAGIFKVIMVHGLILSVTLMVGFGAREIVVV